MLEGRYVSGVGGGDQAEDPLALDIRGLKVPMHMSPVLLERTARMTALGYVVPVAHQVCSRVQRGALSGRCA